MKIKKLLGILSLSNLVVLPLSLSSKCDSKDKKADKTVETDEYKLVTTYDGVLKSFQTKAGFKTDLVLPDEVKTITKNSFDKTVKVRLTSISGKQVTALTPEALMDCPKLVKVDMPEIISVSNDAFKNDVLLKDIILTNIEMTERSAFETTKWWVERKKIAQTKNSVIAINKIILDGTFLKGDVNLSTIGTIDYIADGAFKNNTNITSITGNDLIHINKNAFEGATSLISINAPKLKFIGSYAFKNTKLTSITFNELVSLEQGAFSNISTLKNATLPLIGTLNYEVFANDVKLEEVNMKSLVNIDERAFVNCAVLQWIHTGKALVSYVTESKTRNSFYFSPFNPETNIIKDL